MKVEKVGVYVNGQLNRDSEYPRQNTGLPADLTSQPARKKRLLRCKAMLAGTEFATDESRSVFLPTVVADLCRVCEGVRDRTTPTSNINPSKNGQRWKIYSLTCATTNQPSCNFLSSLFQHITIISTHHDYFNTSNSVAMSPRCPTKPGN